MAATLGKTTRERESTEPAWIVETAWYTVECGDYIGPLKISILRKGEGMAVPALREKVE